MLVTMSPGLLAVAVGQVLGGGDHADQVERQAQFAQAAQRAEHAGGAAHVELHLVHRVGGLERDAAGVEGDALADQHHRLGPPRAAVVVHDDQLGRLAAARATDSSAPMPSFSISASSSTST
jgi:hypothetical protein